MKTFPAKDPDERTDYDFDWGTDRLEAGETLITSVWVIEVAAGVSNDGEEVAGSVTKLWLTGGTAGLETIITNRVTTSEGRTYEKSARIPIRNSGDC